jgi:2-dehydro-3-deoxygluconokinase
VTGDRLDLVSIGECLVEFNRCDGGRSDREHRGDWRFDATFAGDAFNVLFYAARLGLRTGFVSAVGDDLFTPMILKGIEREGIGTSHLLRLPGRHNGLYFIELDEGGEYTFHFWRENSAATETLIHHDLDELAGYISGSRYLLLTGVGLAVLKEPQRLRRLMEMVQGSTTIVFDTNYRARLWNSPGDYRERIDELLPLVDIFLPTLADLQAVYPGVSEPELLLQLAERGPSVIAMKKGGRGCSSFYDGRIEEYPARTDVAVVDTTGAGDAFNAGFIAGLVRGLPIGECCQMAQNVAVQALGVCGAINHGFAL